MIEAVEPDDCVCDNTGKYCFLRELFDSDDIKSPGVLKMLDGEHDIGDGALEDVCDGYDPGCDPGCVRKSLATKRYNRRQIEQLRCIADYRWILEELSGRSVSPDKAATSWVVDGFAAVFARIYEAKRGNGDRIRHSDLYAETEAALR
jgi:hypothetical protein